MTRTTQGLKKVDALLIEKSVSMAKRKGDEYNAFLFAQLEGKRLTESERRNCNVYLFGSEFDRKTIEDLERLP
jgi:hypothetical protein